MVKTNKKKTSKKRKKPTKKLKLLSFQDAFDLHSQRSLKSQIMDNRKTSKKIISDSRWLKYPAKFDFDGVDTKGSFSIPDKVNWLEKNLKKLKKHRKILKRIPKRLHDLTASEIVKKSHEKTHANTRTWKKYRMDLKFLPTKYRKTKTINELNSMIDDEHDMSLINLSYLKPEIDKKKDKRNWNVEGYRGILK